MKNIVTTIRLVALSMLVCCVLYGAAMLAFGQLVPAKANGSLIEIDGKIRGSALLAQGFTQPGYFWPRPSAVDYNASATGGSNLSPANPALAERAAATIASHQLKPDERIPADLVAASGSGMDPHITFEAARFQTARVAAARGLSIDEVNRHIDATTEVATLRVFGGKPVVNVLKLNLALDKAAPIKGQ